MGEYYETGCSIDSFIIRVWRGIKQFKDGRERERERRLTDRVAIEVTHSSADKQ